MNPAKRASQRSILPPRTDGATTTPRTETARLTETSASPTQLGQQNTFATDGTSNAQRPASVISDAAPLAAGRVPASALGAVLGAGASGRRPSADEAPPSTAPSTSGTQKTSAVAQQAGASALRDLLGDWRKASVMAAAKKAAFEALAFTDAINRAVKAECASLESQGVEVSPADIHELRRELVDPAALKAAIEKNWQQLTATPAAAQKAIDDLVTMHRPRLEKARNPFTPIAQNIGNARDQGDLLWENSKTVVIIDTFADSPHVLVVPKQPYLFPCDVPPAVLADMAQVTDRVSRAFQAIASCGPSEAWINPPTNVTVAPVHVHVQPNLEWPMSGPIVNKADEAKLEGIKAAFYEQLKAQLAK